MKLRVDINWLRKKLQDHFGLTPFEAGELICNTMTAGKIIGFAPIATRLPKLSARSGLMADDGQKKDFQIPSELWKFIDIDWEEKSLYFNFHDEQSSWMMPTIEIDRGSADDFLKSQELELRPLQAVVSNISDNSKIKNRRGGRPQEHDWDRFLIYAKEWMRVNGRPDTLAELTRNMFKWFDNKEPSESTLKKYLRLIYYPSESDGRSD